MDLDLDSDLKTVADGCLNEDLTEERRNILEAHEQVVEQITTRASHPDDNRPDNEANICS
jgi:hypothetical protein